MKANIPKTHKSYNMILVEVTDWEINLEITVLKRSGKK